MPLLRLTSVLQTALPHLSEHGRALLSALGCLNGHHPGSREFAAWLGFHDRYQLARALRREGLPPLEIIGGWARTLYWMTEAEASGKSLHALAECEQLDPAVAYRLVRRVTGRRWSEVRREGLAATLRRFRDRCTTAAGRGTLPRPLPLAAGERSVTPERPSAPPVRRQWQKETGVLRLLGNPAAQSLRERVMVDGSPFDVAFTADGEALVTRCHGAALDVLHLHPLRVAHTIPVGPAPTRVLGDRRSSTAHLAYVTTQWAEAVCVIDLLRRQRIASIAVPGHPMGAVLAPSGQTLYVTTNRDQLVAISTLQRTIIGTTSIPLGSPQIGIHPSGHRLLIPSWRAGCIVEVDATTLKTTRRFEVGGTVQDVVMAPDGQTLYAANEAGWLDVIHLPSGRRTATLEFGTAAFGLALSHDATHLFVGLLNAGQVLVLQRQGLIERAAIATGGRPRLIALHPGGDAVLVANEAGWVDLLG